MAQVMVRGAAKPDERAYGMVLHGAVELINMHNITGTVL